MRDVAYTVFVIAAGLGTVWVVVWGLLWFARGCEPVLRPSTYRTGLVVAATGWGGLAIVWLADHL